MNKKLKSLILSFLILFSFLPVVDAEYSQYITYANEVKVMYAADVETGEVFINKNENEILPVASMSKLMTYLVIKDEIEKGTISIDDKVKVTKEAQDLNRPDYSRMNLYEGDIVTVEELLDGLMILSANDAAEALAIHLSKTSSEFVKRMNEKAKEIGLENSNFVNSSGLTEDIKNGDKITNKYNTMTAKDLFILSSKIIENYPETEKYGKIEEYKGFNSTIPNRDMITMTGLKTGYTEEAGYCFTGLFDMSLGSPTQKYKVITVVMGAKTKEQRSTTTREIIDYIEGRYSYRTEFDTNVPVTEKIDEYASERIIPLYPEKQFSKLLPMKAIVEMEYVIDESKSAPYKDGEVLGQAVLRYNGEELETINLINKGYNARVGWLKKIFNGLKEFFNDIINLL